MRGKEYYNNGILKFEWEYNFNKVWNGKFYNKDGIMNFKIKDGQFLKDNLNNN